MSDVPILEHDPAPVAVIEPTAWFAPVEISPHAVITWMPDVVDSVLAEHEAIERGRLAAESAVHPVWEIEFHGRPLVVVLAGVGAPVATLLFEMMIALGCHRFVACGAAGGLVADVPRGTVVVPEASVRDEGVSYHYAPPARLARHDADLQTLVEARCRQDGFEVSTGRTWTTDGLFRETAQQVAARVDEGCVAVEMEAAALATVARFRGVRLGYAVYVADTLHADEWDPEGLVQPDQAFRRRLFDAAARACLDSG